jgi:hypothetical protein
VLAEAGRTLDGKQDRWALYDNSGIEPVMLEWGENQ